MNGIGLGNRKDIAEMTACDFQGWVIKDTVVSAMLSLGLFVLGKPAPMTWRYLNSPWKGPYAEKQSSCPKPALTARHFNE